MTSVLDHFFNGEIIEDMQTVQCCLDKRLQFWRICWNIQIKKKEQTFASKRL